jgi:hypothetical protein
MHLNDNSLFCVLTSLDVMCSPNNRFMTDIMVSSFFVSLIVKHLTIAALHLFPIFTVCSPYWYMLVSLGGITLNAWSISLTNTWLSSLSYPLSAVTTDNGRVLAIFIISGWKSILSCRFGVHVWFNDTNYLFQYICS